MTRARNSLFVAVVVLGWLSWSSTVSALLAADAPPAPAAGDAPPDGPHEEKWPNGKTKIQTTYKGGLLNGAYTEYYESSKLHIKALYKDGKREGNYIETAETGYPKLNAVYKNGDLNGAYTEFDDKGQVHLKATYAAGKRHGPLTEYAADGRTVAVQIDYDKGVPKKINGADAFPKSKDAILAELKAIMKGHEFTGKVEDRFTDAPSSTLPLKAGGLKKAYEEDGLAYMNIYRYLAGVPYKQLRLDPENSKYAQAISVLCQYQFDIKAWPPPNPHHPPQLPEVDRNFWTLADKGGHGSNIYDHHKAISSIRLAIIDWVRDSNTDNLHAVGHRRWMFFPGLETIGFGEAGRMNALYYQPIKPPTFAGDFIAWPPPGYLPVEYFGDNWAWSITLTNTGKYKVPASADAYDVEIVPLDNDYNPAGAALKLNHKVVDTTGYGIPNCLIWRPDGLKVEDGKKYRVTVTLDKANPATSKITYFVEFMTDGSTIPPN